MSITGRSVLSTQDLTIDQAHSIFELAEKLHKQGSTIPAISKSMICAFFEPSTRTRLSFQMAALQAGVQTINFDTTHSSLSKGETLGDTVLNLVAMKPDLLVIRYGDSVELDQLLPTLKVPILSGGSGRNAHPTQALLDAFTILKERGRLSGEKVFIVGDIKHSRVARSNYELLTRLGCEVGFCGPKAMLPLQDEFPKAIYFSSVKEGLAWATVCMGLRIQLERHSAGLIAGENISESDYHARFGISSSLLKSFANDGIIMHPGPINQGLEFASEVLADHRCRVLQQVTYGVAVRAALIKKVLGVA